MREVEDVANVCTDPAILADGLRLSNNFHAIALGCRHSAVTASCAWLISTLAHEIKRRPELNPKGVSALATGRWLLTIVQSQIEAIEQMDALDRERLGELFWQREISAPPGFTPPPSNADRPVVAAPKQRRVSSHG